METLDVLIIGAGASGLTAAYDLGRESGYTFKILEASEGLGGRLQKNDNFTNFPIDIGGEWIQRPPTVLDEIVDDPLLKPTDEIETIKYLDYVEELDDGKWTVISEKNEDHKFVDYTWFDFFNDWIAPNDNSTIDFNCQVDSIDYTNIPVVVTCVDGRTYRADHVIVTASMKVLQDNDIDFTPPLPQEYQTAIDEYIFMPGMKVFLKFKNAFYKESFEFGWDYPANHQYGERYFYSETFGQNTSDHILGNFMVGENAMNFTVMTDPEVVDYILKELDQVFDGQATPNYIDSVVQNWVDEPFVRGAYTQLEEDDDKYLYSVVGTLRDPVDNRIFFAGEAVPDDDDTFEYGFAHGAAFSGRAAARKIIMLLDAASGSSVNRDDKTSDSNGESSGSRMRMAYNLMFHLGASAALMWSQLAK